MRIILGTGSEKTNESFEYHFRNHDEIQFVGTVSYKEGVEQIVSRLKPDVIILSDKLGGIMPLEDVIKRLRTNPPFVRIVFLMTETNEALKKKLYLYSCYDVIDRNKEKVSVEDMENILLNPRKYEDVIDDLKELEKFADQRSLGASFEKKYDVTEKEIDGSRYNRLKVKHTGKSPQRMKVSAFWSVSDLTGKTFSAVNSSIYLANNPELKVLLLDFNIHNPNVHLQFATMHPKRNLTELIKYYKEHKELRPHIFREFLIQHPKGPNLYILPGDIIYHQNIYEVEELEELLDQIIDTSLRMNFSSVLIDMSSGFTHPINKKILREANEIFFHVNGCPSSLNATKHFFDLEQGPIIKNRISFNKIYTVLNRVSEEFYQHTIEVLNNLIAYNDLVAKFYENKEIKNSILTGNPILTENHTIVMDEFNSIASVIHPYLFKTHKEKTEKKGKGLFSFLR